MSFGPDLAEIFSMFLFFVILSSFNQAIGQKKLCASHLTLHDWDNCIWPTIKEETG